MSLTGPAGGEGPIVAILAGGRGRRMGGRKHAAMLAGRPLLAYPLMAARQAGLPAVIVGKQELERELAGIGLGPAAGEVALLVEPPEPRHPLCGILAALEAAGAAGVLAVGCDMPFLTGALLERLACLSQTAIARVGGAPQPLPGRYLPEDRPILERVLGEEGSMRRALAALSPRVLAEEELEPFGDPARLCFSVNDRGDLLTAQEWLRAGDPRPRRPGARPAR